MLTVQQIERNKSIITRALLSTKREGMQNLLGYLYNNGFFIGPSSTKHHEAYMGGNAEHSIQVWLQLREENKTLPYVKRSQPDSIAIVALLHDVCKIDNYIINEDGNISYNKDCVDKRHAEKSIDIIEKFIKLTQEEKEAIKYHMGIYWLPDYEDTYQEGMANEIKNYWNEFGSAIKRYPLVYITHVADMKATYGL